MALGSVRVGPVGFAGGLFGTAAALVIGGLAVNDPQLHWVALLSYAVAACLILWGTTIHDFHLWQLKRWTRGPPRPVLNAALLDFPYQGGTVINGIKWMPGYSHVSLLIANHAEDPMTDLNLLIYLDRHIIGSGCRSSFAECVIGEADKPIGQTTLVGTDADGNEIAIVVGEQNTISIAPAHRLVCHKLPVRAQIDVDIATVRPLPEPPFWGHDRDDPSWVAVEGSFVIRDQVQQVLWRADFGKVAK